MADPDRNIISVFNEQVIAEFRANEGRVGGPLAGTPILLLHHIGACRHQCADGRNRRPPSGGHLEALARRGARGWLRVRRWRDGSADALPVCGLEAQRCFRRGRWHRAEMNDAAAM